MELTTRKASSYVPAVVPAGGRVVSISLSLVTTAVIIVFLCQRLRGLHSWKTIPLTRWLILAIYTDSFLFVFSTAIISQGLGLNNSRSLCEGAITLCLTCYMTTKVMIYLFLVERVRIVRGVRKPRTKDKLYLFNFFGMLLPYLVVIVLNFLYRFARINRDGMCIIGMKIIATIPLITFDVVANVYLTSLFIVPLWNAYSFRNKINNRLRKTALRAFIGAGVTLASSVANLTILVVLRGEPGWICLICCNSDILFSVIVLQWVTSGDSPLSRPAYEYPRTPRPNQVFSSIKTPSKGPELFDVGGTRDFPGGDIITSTSRHNVMITQSSAEESEQKAGSAFDSFATSATPAMIMKRTSLTIESTREEEPIDENDIP